VISENLKRDFLKAYPANRIPVHTFHDGSVVADANQNNKRNGVIGIGYIGSLYKGKGIELIAEVAKLLPNHFFNIYGGNEKEINDLKKQFPVPNIIWHGSVPPSVISKVYNSLEICLLPNQKYIQTGKSENNISNYTSPLKLFEYMAHGKAIIASALPSLMEVLNGENSILVPYNQPEEWAKAITKLVTNRDLIERLGKKAKEDFENNYTWNVRAKSLINIIQS